MTASVNSPILSAREVYKAFGKFVAVGGISFDIMPGERRALIGPNGAGKSTFINIIGGQMPGAKGNILFKNNDISGMLPHEISRAGIGRTFQISRTYLLMSVYENMMSAFCVATNATNSLSGNRFSELNDRVWAMLETVGMADRANNIVEDISLGDRKRLELGMTLAGAPELLMLDEPTAGMGLGERHTLMDLVVELVESTGMSLLFVEHDIDVVFKVAQKVTVMVRGHILVEGSPEEIANNSDVQDVYLGGGH